MEEFMFEILSQHKTLFFLVRTVLDSLGDKCIKFFHLDEAQKLIEGNR